jgi:dipeptidyl-peptidase-4
MKMRTARVLHPPRLIVLVIALACVSTVTVAQDRLKTMPGYERYKKYNSEIPGSVKPGALSVTWKDGGAAFEYRKAGKNYRYDIATKSAHELPKAPASSPGRRTPPGLQNPARGRQYNAAPSPDGVLRAFTRDRNLWLSDARGVIELAVTNDGNEKARVKYGTASWVYGEELYQNSAIWWAPDSKKVAYYRFDESKVTDYYLTLRQTQLQDRLDVEPYPKAGTPNPVAEVFIFDVETKQTVKVDVRDGKEFKDEVVGHYVYGVSWTPGSKALLFHRTNRAQNVLELAACDPATGKCRVLVREEWPESWVENLPTFRLLEDGKRFIWSSERTGWKNFLLYDLSGKLLATLTDHPFEVNEVVAVVESTGHLFYTARSGDNPMKLQVHRVGLDGRGDHRLTDPAYHHDVNVAPDGKHFIDIAQAHDAPPVTRLRDAEGVELDELACSDLTKYEQLGLSRVEMLRFKAADGKTELFGVLHRPSDFDPKKEYPLLVSVYAGPGTNGANEGFTLPSSLTELGFLVASFDSRSAGGRGKRFLDAIYKKLGQVEVDDQAAGVKSLWDRPYVDRSRVGMFGASYGGTVSITSLVRYPDVFQAACGSSPVIDYRNYDTIYTERYMGTPQQDKPAYDAANPIKQVDKLKGRLMLYFGTADNNVHPSNSLQLIQALQRAGKSFELQIGPDQGHSGIRRERMMEFFIDSLVLRKP